MRKEQEKFQVKQKILALLKDGETKLLGAADDVFKDFKINDQDMKCFDVQDELGNRWCQIPSLLVTSLDQVKDLSRQLIASNSAALTPNDVYNKERVVFKDKLVGEPKSFWFPFCQKLSLLQPMSLPLIDFASLKQIESMTVAVASFDEVKTLFANLIEATNLRKVKLTIAKLQISELTALAKLCYSASKVSELVEVYTEKLYSDVQVEDLNTFDDLKELRSIYRVDF